jgi:hypothetical protein
MPFAETLRAMHARIEAERKQEAAEETRCREEAALHRMAKLEDRLRRLLQTIPIEVQREGLSLRSLQSCLRGRWRGNCHPGELGAALRKLRFERRRLWKSAAGFSARWYPMEVGWAGGKRR